MAERRRLERCVQHLRDERCRHIGAQLSRCLPLLNDGEEELSEPRPMAVRQAALLPVLPAALGLAVHGGRMTAREEEREHEPVLIEETRRLLAALREARKRRPARGLLPHLPHRAAPRSPRP